MYVCSESPSPAEQDSGSPAAPWMQEAAARRKSHRPLPAPGTESLPQPSSPTAMDPPDTQTTPRRDILSPLEPHARHTPTETTHINNNSLSHIPDELPQRKVLPPLQ